MYIGPTGCGYENGYNKRRRGRVKGSVDLTVFMGPPILN